MNQISLITGTKYQQKLRMLESVNQYFKIADDEIKNGASKKSILTKIAHDFGYTEINSIRNNIAKVRKSIIESVNKYQKVVEVFAKNKSISTVYEVIEIDDVVLEYMLMCSYDYKKYGDNITEPIEHVFNIKDKEITITDVNYLNFDIILLKEDKELLESIIKNNIVIDITKNW